MKRRSKSKQWHRRHVSDFYVKKAQQAGYRSRSAYKLAEIHEAERIFSPGQCVVDLGAAPGGWSQVALDALKGQGVVVGVDLLPVDALTGAEFLQGDFRSQDVIDQLFVSLNQTDIDVVLSDMAPNLSGVRCVDQAKSIGLAENVLAFCLEHLSQQGTLLIKVFQGEGFDSFFSDFKKGFSKVKTKKPKASRDQSKEIYLLGRDLR